MGTGKPSSIAVTTSLKETIIKSIFFLPNLNFCQLFLIITSSKKIRFLIFILLASNDLYAYIDFIALFFVCYRFCDVCSLALMMVVGTQLYAVACKS